MSIHISSSGMVYEDAEKLYAEVRKDGETLLEAAFSALFPKSMDINAAAAAKVSGDIIGFNTTFFPRRDVVEIPLTGGSAAKAKLVQASKRGTTGYALLDCSEGGHLCHPVGFFADCMTTSGKLCFPAVGCTIALSSFLVFTNGSDHFVLRNSSLQLTISNGRITSLLDVQLGCAFSDDCQ